MRWTGGSLGVFQISYYNITHISLRACKHCMYWYGILEGTIEWRYNYRDGEDDTAPENFGIYSFIEHDRFDLFTYEGRIMDVMYVPCVKCSCSELKLEKHLHTFFVLT